MIAKYLFTDSFRLYRLESKENATADLTKELVINQTNITHTVDKEEKFKINPDEP